MPEIDFFDIIAWLSWFTLKMTDQIETLTSSNISGLSGEMIIPGDKSVSHRSLILGGMAIGQTKVTGLLMGADVLATLDAAHWG